jgi:hypothetical protein
LVGVLAGGAFALRLEAQKNPAPSPGWLEGVFGIAGLVVFGLWLCLEFGPAAATYRTIPITLTLSMAKIRLACETSVAVLWPMFCFAILYVASLWTLFLVLFVVTMIYFLSLCTPPTIIYLGASTSQQTTFVSALDRHLGLLKMYYLLRNDMNDIREYVHFRDDVEGFIFQTNNLRTFEFVGWKRIVETLVDMCPIVVLDCRCLNQAVRYECMYITRSNHLDKTIIITGDTIDVELRQLIPLNGGNVVNASDGTAISQAINRIMALRRATGSRV